MGMQVNQLLHCMLSNRGSQPACLQAVHVGTGKEHLEDIASCGMVARTAAEAPSRSHGRFVVAPAPQALHMRHAHLLNITAHCGTAPAAGASIVACQVCRMGGRACGCRSTATHAGVIHTGSPTLGYMASACCWKMRMAMCDACQR